MTVVAVTGLRAEAAIATRAALAVVCAGGVPARTEAALERALAAEANGLVSLGIAGGLAPSLRPGTLVLGRAVLGPDGERYDTDARWTARIRGAITAVEGDVLGEAVPAASAIGKAALHAASGALAVDLESLAVARAARRHGLPCLVLRAIADPAARDLPPAALIALRADGRPDLPRVLRSLLRQPGQLGGLICLAGDTRRALRALGAAVQAARSQLIAPRG